MRPAIRMWPLQAPAFVSGPVLFKAKIAAFGSSYMGLRRPVGAAEGCDLLLLPLFGVQMQGRNDLAVFFRFAQLGIDEVHTVIGELAFIDQIVLDAAGALLAQLTQQHFAGTPE